MSIKPDRLDKVLALIEKEREMGYRMEALRMWDEFGRGKFEVFLKDMVVYLRVKGIMSN